VKKGRKKKGDITRETREHTWKEKWLKQSGKKKESGANRCDPADRQRNGKWKKEYFLVGQGCRKGEKKGVMEVKRVDGYGGLKKSNGNDRYDSQKEKKIQMKRSPYLFKRVSDRPQKPKKKQEKYGVS
jgi:hypothetical protein